MAQVEGPETAATAGEKSTCLNSLKKSVPSRKIVTEASVRPARMLSAERCKIALVWNPGEEQIFAVTEIIGDRGKNLPVEGSVGALLPELLQSNSLIWPRKKKPS
jgi:hypothetical protein